MERRLLILPVVWGLYGFGLIFGLQYLLGSITNNVPYGVDDKPIGGSVLPVLFFNASTIMGVIALSLYATGFWKPNLASNQARIELGAITMILFSGFMLWYSALFFFPAVAALVALMAVNIQ